MNGQHIRQTCLYLIVAVVLQACVSIPFATKAPQSLPPDMLGTIVGGTAAAAQTQTALVLPPSSTPSLTRTPSPTPTLTTPTPTFFFSLSTFTPTPTETLLVPTPLIPDTGSGNAAATSAGSSTGFTGEEWTCIVLEKTFLTVKPKESFSLFVTFRNTGTKTWTNNGVDFVYTGGYRHEGKRIQDLPAITASGNAITLSVEFAAPKQPGTRHAFWALRVGNNPFCGVKLSFEVKEK